MISPQELRIGNRVNITEGTGVIKSVDVEVKEVKLEYDNNIGGDRTYIRTTDIDSGFEIKEIIIADGEYSGIELEFNTNSKDGFILLYDLRHSPDLSDFTRAHDIVKKGTTLRFMLEKTETKDFSFNGNFNLVDSLSPIPLTEDILLENSYKTEDFLYGKYIFISYSYSIEGSLKIEYYTSNIDGLGSDLKGKYFSNGVQLHTVHQLQNLYYILKNKDINLTLKQPSTEN